LVLPDLSRIGSTGGEKGRRKKLSDNFRRKRCLAGFDARGNPSYTVVVS